MSAAHATHRPDQGVFEFVQEHAIPAYLIAIACGVLVSREIGPRTSVWCEQAVLDDACFEFAQTEEFLSVAEEFCGPYVWGRYDLLVLPPSFPYGGMENVNITFVTPTLIAGDRSVAEHKRNCIATCTTK